MCIRDSNTATPSTATTFTFTGSSEVGAWARTRSSSATASEPVVTGATQDGGVDWVAGIEHDIVVIRDDEGVKYYFVPAEVLQSKTYFGITVTNETADIATGTAIQTRRMPCDINLTEVRANVTTAPTGANLIVDIKLNATSIFTTNLLSIDAGEYTSVTALTAPNITTTLLTDDSEITIDVTQIGSTVAGTGLKILLIGT